MLKLSKIITLLFIVSLFHLSISLFQDQIGKFDWKINQLGKLKFSSIDSKRNSKYVYIATEENVIAVLSAETGEIRWRQILEKGDQGKIQLMRVDVELITISGCGPFIVRGWKTDLGSLAYEWNIPTARWPEVHWILNQHNLFMVSIGQQQAEVSVFNVRVGGHPTVHSLSLPHLPQKHTVVVAGQSLVYWDESGTQLVGVTVNGKQQPSVLPLAGPSPLDLQPVVSVSDNAYVQVASQLIKVAPERLSLVQTEVPPGSSIAVHSHSEQNMVITVQHINNKELELSGRILESEAVVPNLGSRISHTFPLARAQVNSVLCVSLQSQSVVCQLLLSGADDSILFVQAPGNLVWVREESLTSIVNMELVDLPVSDIEVAIEKEFNNKEGGFVGMFVRRVASQLVQLHILVMTVFGLREPQAGVNGRADLVKDDFGLHKMIVAVTSVGKVFGIDNLSHEVIWQFSLEDTVPFQTIGKAHVPLFVQRTTRHHPYPAQCVVLFRHKFTKESVLYAFNPITGKPTDGEAMRLGYQVVQAVQLSSVDEQFMKGVLLLEADGEVHVYPESSRQTAISLAPSTFIFTADAASGHITGYSMNVGSGKELVAVPMWEVKLFTNITAVVGKSPVERVHSQGRVMADRSVLYKYINPNLVVVATQTEDVHFKNVLSVYLIDVVSGSIVYSNVHKRIMEPVHIVHSENWVVYSFVHEKLRRTEIITLDLYEGTMQSNTTVFSSVWNTIVPIVEKKSYILPAFVDAMRETITEKGITNKHVLVALDSGGVMEMPWVLLDPRRPSHVGQEMREEGVIPYVPELPIISEAIINYNQTLLRVKGIHTSPSGLESTCLVTVYGLDIFYTRVAPSKTFDMLKDDFDYTFITAVLLGLTVSALVTKKLAERKALKQAWK